MKMTGGSKPTSVVPVSSDEGDERRRVSRDANNTINISRRRRRRRRWDKNNNDNNHTTEVETLVRVVSHHQPGVRVSVRRAPVVRDVGEDAEPAGPRGGGWCELSAFDPMSLTRRLGVSTRFMYVNG